MNDYDSLADRIRELYKQGNTITTTSLVTACILAFGLYYLTNDNLTVYWIVIFGCFSALRYLLILVYKKQSRDDEDVLKWGWYFVAGTFISGSIWGGDSTFIFGN